MKNVENHPTGDHLKIVAALWETHHPSQIADAINTRYGYLGPLRWTYYHVENAHQTIARLDRGEMLGRKL